MDVYKEEERERERVRESKLIMANGSLVAILSRAGAPLACSTHCESYSDGLLSAGYGSHLATRLATFVEIGLTIAAEISSSEIVIWPRSSPVLCSDSL